MKNIGASVSEVLTQEKKEAEVEKQLEEEEEEECIPMKNEVIFFLKEAPEYRISGVAEWGENARGDIVREVDIYFRHISTGQRCESVRDCFAGWSEPEKKAEEEWEALCQRIEDLPGIEEIICVEERVEV